MAKKAKWLEKPTIELMEMLLEMIKEDEVDTKKSSKIIKEVIERVEEDEDDEEDDEEEDEEEDEEDYGDLSLAELKKLCRERGLKVKKGSNKADLIQQLEDDDEDEE